MISAGLSSSGNVLVGVVFMDFLVSASRGVPITEIINTTATTATIITAATLDQPLLLPATHYVTIPLFHCRSKKNGRGGDA